MAKILVVDDDPATLKMFSTYLARQGWTVLKALSGQEGLRLAQSERPDIVLSDIGMSGMTGFDFLAKLRASPETARLPVVLITGNRKQAEDIESGLYGGAQGYILKGGDLRLVHAKLEAVLKAGQGARTGRKS